MTQTEPLALAPVASATLDTVHCTDLLALCRGLGDASIDMILCDLPYGTTACSWDTIIPFAPMWAQFKRVIKPRGAIVLTASQPFTSALVMSNPGMFRHEWVWEKVHANNFIRCNIEPQKRHENILIFANGDLRYTPQMSQGKPYIKFNTTRTALIKGKTSGAMPKNSWSVNDGRRWPSSIVKFDHDDKLHPTQKPVALFEYLIRTYTQPGDVVLDPCVGSGTTAVACRNLDRRYICGDSSAEYVEIARKRLADTDPYQATVLPNGAVQHSLFEGLAI